VIVVGADRRREALVALRALSLLAARLPHLQATIFASDADADAARLAAAALNVAGRIEWRAAGAARADVLAIATMSWVIAASDEEAFAILDSFAAGVPVLAERTPVSARYVEEGVSGFLRHRGEEASWASVIAAALAQPALLESLRAGAKRGAARWPADVGADGWLQAADAARDRARWVA
jgi:glycosyltransferase involved in cell wall biosynthesis